MARAIDISILYEALASPFGVILECSDPERVRQKLYEIRRKAADKDKDLESISVLTSPTNPSRDLWIVRKGKDSNATP